MKEGVFATTLQWMATKANGFESKIEHVIEAYKTAEKLTSKEDYIDDAELATRIGQALGKTMDQALGIDFDYNELTDDGKLVCVKDGKIIDSVDNGIAYLTLVKGLIEDIVKNFLEKGFEDAE